MENTASTSTNIIQIPIQATMVNQTPVLELPTPEINKVGQSVFYDCIDLSPTAEKQDDMKPERSDTEEESTSNTKNKSKSNSFYRFKCEFSFFFSV